MALSQVPPRLPRRRKYPHDQTREVFEAAKSGDAVLLNEVLQEMNSSERTSALETKIFHDDIKLNFRQGCGSLETKGESNPLIVAAGSGNLDCVKILLTYKANIESRGHIFYKTKVSTSPLIAAAGNGHVDVSSFLLENGADVNACTNDNCSPLMAASFFGHVDGVNFLVQHGANTDLQDKDGYTALHHALSHKHESCDVVSCLIKNGADVNACTNDDCTPLMIASDCDNVDAVNCVIEHGANIELQDKDGKTALHHAVHVKCASFDVLSSLIKNGGDVNARTNKNCTPLMIASRRGHVNLVAFLIERGADMDVQDTNGDTALHYAVRAISNSTEIVHTLLSFGASQLHNSEGLTPLLLASNNCNSSVVEDLIKRPECTKEQRVDALELLGASLNTASVTRPSFFQVTIRAFCYIKRGMEERFADPSHPLLKQPMEPVEAYQNRKESQSLEELALIEGDINDIIIESLMIRERILGTNNALLLGPIRSVAGYYKYYCHFISGHFICIELHRHAMKISQSCNQSAICDLIELTSLLSSKSMWRGDVFLELLEQTVLEYDIQQKLKRGLENESHLSQIEETLESLFDSTMKLLEIIVKFISCEDNKTFVHGVLVLLRRLCCLNPRDESDDTLLHKAVEHVTTDGYPFPDIVKLLLNAGFNVNAINSNGDTPLHNFITNYFSKESHHLVGMLKVLLDGGAHHDFVNNDGKTAMDMANTDEACRILSEKRKLELKCISARAVKKFGLPYLGMVPKTLEKYISMH